MQARANRVVVMENAVLEQMASNKAFLNEFPSLRKILVANKAAGDSCSGCTGTRAGSARGDTYQEVKMALSGMATSRKSLLKQMLNTDKIEIVFRGSNGKAVRNKF